MTKSCIKFKAQQIDVLVATDIVARGIDIDDIQLVINFDVPHDAEDYVHRIGRTARANNDGKAITLVSENDQRKFAAIERFLDIEIEKKPIPAELGEAPEYKGKDKKKSNPDQKKKSTRRKNKKTAGAKKDKKHEIQETAAASPDKPASESGAPNATETSGQTEKKKKKKRRHKPRNKKEDKTQETNNNNTVSN